MTGEIYLLKHNSLFVYVGGNLYDISGNYTYNGGGIGEVNGGGATDIRLINGEWNDFSSLKSRIMVAAGGGGGFLSYDKTSPYYIYSMIERKPGNAGGLVGYDADALYVANNKYMSSTGESGKGGTQTLAGNVEIKESTGYAYKTPGYSIIKASFGKGGLGQYSNGGHTADGGGSGYYGGSHGIHPGSSYPGGGGGSSFISGHNGCVAITEDSTESNIKQRTDSNGKTCTDGTTDITCSYHYSGYKFTDTIMIDGAGYNWTTVKGDYVGQPQPDGTITTGHSGNGYARITYIGE